MSVKLSETASCMNGVISLTKTLAFTPTSDMTLRLLNVPRLSDAVASGIVGMREGLRSGAAGAAASCGDGRRRREEERCNRTLAVTAARVDEWRRDNCMIDRVAWTEREMVNWFNWSTIDPTPVLSVNNKYNSF